MARAEICVIFNPASGKHRGRSRLERIRQSWEGHAEFRPTEHTGHAIDLAEQAAREGFACVVAAGGDGTAHEVLNGLMRVRNPEVAFTILPIGSANDYAYSLGIDGTREVPLRRVDVACVKAPNGKQVYFGCCLGLGLNGRVTLESRRIGWLQGVFLYGLATIRALLYHYECPPMTFSIDDEPPWSAPTLLFTALVGKREGSISTFCRNTVLPSSKNSWPFGFPKWERGSVESLAHFLAWAWPGGSIGNGSCSESPW